MRRPFIAGNWKMNLDFEAAMALAQILRRMVRDRVDGDVGICPPYPFLQPIAKALEGSAVQVGAQDVDPEISGARTGAVSASMLRSTGCAFTLVGHSERRDIFGDTDDLVALKLRAGLNHELQVMLCIGEHLAERQAFRTFEVVLDQLDIALADLSLDQISRITLAYEPVWAIGTGLSATPEQAQEVHEGIRAHIAKLFTPDVAASIRILYGGSVKPSNAAELLAQPDVDGALVGGASLKADSFVEIVRAQTRS
jgi:triosephosphate isomerase